MTTPLPCPFCGASPEMADGSICHTSDDREKWGAIQCLECGATGPDVRTEYEPFLAWRDDAVAEWNRRAGP